MRYYAKSKLKENQHSSQATKSNHLVKPRAKCRNFNFKFNKGSSGARHDSRDGPRLRELTADTRNRLTQQYYAS